MVASAAQALSLPSHRAGQGRVLRRGAPIKRQFNLIFMVKENKTHERMHT
jgi:hypothetical protein